MEDIVQYIIYGIIIISFFSSFFKKKEEPKKPPVRQPDNQQRESIEYTPAQSYESKQEKEESYDLLNEIETLFKQQTSNYKAPPVIIPAEIKTPQTAGDRRTVLEHAQAVSERSKSEAEHSFDRSWHQMTENKMNVPFIRKTAAEKRDIAEKADMLEKLLAREAPDNKLIMQFRKKLLQPDTLREYVIATEILNRPKAFRR